MKREIASIMKPSGLEFDWRMMGDRRTGESFHDLMVFTFKGRCQAVGPTYDELGPLDGRLPLAYTQMSDGKILPYSDVECDTIRSYISPAFATAKPGVRNEILGRALGRVVAHEMYHILARTKNHAGEGIARSFHTRQDLTEPEFRFTEKEFRILRVSSKR